ncbi:MAG: PQQ-binding-like beta-propeller repeat protein [Deltaproteobacteria bacterium]|nr:PQQ-binding-like beta-propeller repeat protein [Deltaproteobacteria bacterium]
MTTFMLLALLAAPGPLGDRPPEARALIDELLTPEEVPAPGFPYRSPELKGRPASGVRLREVSAEKNQITDHDEWYARHDLPRCVGLLDPGSEQVPAETRWGRLHAYRAGPEVKVGIYVRPEPVSEAAVAPVDAAIYTEQFDYTAVLFSRDLVPTRVLRLVAFHPGILELSHAELVGTVLYFDANYNGYASIMKKRTGYLIALDLTTGRVLWTTKSLTASFWGFVVWQDVLVAGYGFTAEPDFLFLLDRDTGAVLQTVKLRTAHEVLIPRGDLLYVRCYDHDHVFRFE